MIANLLLPLVTWLPLPAASLAQDPPPVQDERPEVKTLIDELKEHVKQRGEEDPQAIEAVDKLYSEFSKSGPKDQKDIVGALVDCFDAKRPKELEPDVPDDRLYMACAVALGGMGPESVKPLTKLLDDKDVKKNLKLDRQIALSLGKTKDESAVKELLYLLKNPAPEMQAAGAEALGEFGEVDQKTRKKIVDEIIKIMMGQKTKVDNSPTDPEAAQRWSVISGPMIASLQRLTGNEENVPEEWQRWWNKNKKEDWDAPKN